jgi:proteic killer suppression protein
LRVEFRSKKLEKCFLDSSKAVREWGETIARRYIQRINILQAAKTLYDLNSLPGLKCHRLKGNRAGQYAVRLDGAWRLIFSIEGDVLKVICILEVSRHYDD